MRRSPLLTARGSGRRRRACLGGGEREVRFESGNGGRKEG